MGWFDKLWRRPQGGASDDVHELTESEEEVAEELEEEAHEARDQQAFEEPRPPGG